jgi:hypothetical protein
MEVSYTFTVEDYWEMVRYLWSRPQARFSLVINSLLPLMILLILGFLQRKVLPMFILGCLATAAMVPFNLWLRRRKAQAWLNRNQHTFSQVTVGVSPEGCHLKTVAGEGLLRWMTFQSVAKAGSYIYFIYKSGAATLVPERAFASSADAQSFLEAATAYWSSATGAPGPSTA